MRIVYHASLPLLPYHVNVNARQGSLSHSSLSLSPLVEHSAKALRVRLPCLCRERRRAENPDAMEDDVDEVPCITKAHFEEVS
jgi:hypothetical protein